MLLGQSQNVFFQLVPVRFQGSSHRALAHLGTGRNQVVLFDKELRQLARRKLDERCVAYFRLQPAVQMRIRDPEPRSDMRAVEWRETLDKFRYSFGQLARVFSAFVRIVENE